MREGIYGNVAHVHPLAAIAKTFSPRKIPFIWWKLLYPAKLIFIYGKAVLLKKKSLFRAFV